MMPAKAHQIQINISVILIRNARIPESVRILPPADPFTRARFIIRKDEEADARAPFRQIPHGGVIVRVRADAAVQLLIVKIIPEAKVNRGTVTGRIWRTASAFAGRLQYLLPHGLRALLPVQNVLRERKGPAHLLFNAREIKRALKAPREIPVFYAQKLRIKVKILIVQKL